MVRTHQGSPLIQRLRLSGLSLLFFSKTLSETERRGTTSNYGLPHLIRTPMSTTRMHACAAIQTCVIWHAVMQLFACLGRPVPLAAQLIDKHRANEVNVVPIALNAYSKICSFIFYRLYDTIDYQIKRRSKAGCTAISKR